MIYFTHSKLSQFDQFWIFIIMIFLDSIGRLFCCQRWPLTGSIYAVATSRGDIGIYVLFSAGFFSYQIPMIAIIYNHQLEFPLYRRLHLLDFLLFRFHEPQHLLFVKVYLLIDIGYVLFPLIKQFSI